LRGERARFEFSPTYLLQIPLVSFEGCVDLGQEMPAMSAAFVSYSVPDQHTPEKFVWPGREPARRLLLVDGHAYAYRAFFAIKRLSAPDGRPTNAIYGFIKMFNKLRAQLQPTHHAVVWDGGLASHRVAALPGYKAQRPPMPGDLETQLDEIASWLQASHIASLCQEGVEADDWIATLARQAEKAGFVVVIATSDKDFMQLVSPRIGLFNPNDKSETVWRAEQVGEKTGVEPEQIVDWLSLVGDAVDNIPGVSGVGTKTAAELLRQFGSIESLYQRLDEVKSTRVRAALEAAVGDVRRNRDLIRLREDVPGGFDAGEWAAQPGDVGRLLSLYQRWGFQSLQRELEASQPAQGALL
jgi:DNA polymerase-1